MTDLVNYVINQCWCSFKNDNRSLFVRSLWILGANKYKHKDIMNSITEDITIFYKNSSHQLRGFNGNQPTLSEKTLKNLNQEKLIEYIKKHNIIDKKIKKLIDKVDFTCKTNDFKQLKIIFKKMVKYNCQINAFEYLINSLAMNLYKDLSETNLIIFNKWKSDDSKNNYSFYFDFFKYLTIYFKINISTKTFINYIHVNEVLNFLDNKLQKKTLLKRINIRKKGFILLNLNVKKYNNKIITNINIIKPIQTKLELLQNCNLNNYLITKKVVGKAVFNSDLKIRGKCVVIKNNYDSPKNIFNKILVCSIADANDIYKYLDVKALVVDHGGILCHAAIFSREFNKPCLMGCDIATKIFSTGDIIEIDLKNEIVYKINN